MGCGRPCRPGLSTSGRPWSTCCGACGRREGQHEHNCGCGSIQFTAWHGTDLAAAEQIQRHGFKPSTGGALGEGVYVTKDRNKAESYRKPCARAPRGALLELEVTIGTVKRISGQQDPYRTTWQRRGYDGAYAPAGAVGQREENCVKDTRQIRIVRLHTT
jgi:hypothetical protein